MRVFISGHALGLLDSDVILGALFGQYFDSFRDAESHAGSTGQQLPPPMTGSLVDTVLTVGWSRGLLHVLRISRKRPILSFLRSELLPAFGAFMEAPDH